MSEFTQNAGVFTVGTSGKISYDFLYDGGGYRGELAIFSLDGMENYAPGSYEFTQEAARRALTNSGAGYVLVSDRQEKAKFSANLPWEGNFNYGEYQGPRLIELNPGGEYALMLIPNNTVAEIYTNSSLFENIRKAPIYSMPEYNPGAKVQQFTEDNPVITDVVKLDKDNIYGFEDIRVDTGGDRDFNDIVVEIEGVKSNLPTFDEIGNPGRDFYTGDLAEQIDNYTKANTASFGEISSSTGQVSVDWLYDGGGYWDASVGIFSLQGLNYAQMGEEAFVKEAVKRSLTNTEAGYVILEDRKRGVRYSSSLDWERNFNYQSYEGAKTLKLTPNISYGLVIIPDGMLKRYQDNHLSDHLTNRQKIRKRPLFSMPYANDNLDIHMVDELTNGGVMVGFEDRPLLTSDRDYNDIILRFEGIKSDIPDLQENANLLKHNWLSTNVGQEILQANNMFLDNLVDPTFIA